MESVQLPDVQDQPLIILNPTANRGKIDRYRQLVQPYREQTQAEYVETRRAGEAEQLAYQAAQAGVPVVIVGGDGSVNEVINGLLRSNRRVPLGIVPAGSGNDFATSTLGIPANPVQAVERAFYGKIVTVDAGVLNGRYFANACSIGLDADIAATVGAMKKIPLMSGERLYYASILKQLLFGYHHCPWLTISLDGQPVTPDEQRYVLVAISNGPAYGAGFRINPQANYQDGLFDVCTIDYLPLLRAMRLLPVVKKGEHAWIPEVTFHRVRHITITSRFPVHRQVDGETLRETHFDASILPGALAVRV